MSLPNLGLRVFVRPEFHVGIVGGVRTLRFEWNVVNYNSEDFIGPNRNTNPEQFTKIYGAYPAVANAWSLLLFHEAQGLGIEHVGPAFLLWDYRAVTESPFRYRDWYRTGVAGLSPFSEAFAPGFLTSFPLGEIEDGRYFAVFTFDPLNLWGGFTYANPFWLRIEGLSAVPVDL